MLPLLLALAVPSIASAYTWNFTNTPAQCQTLSLQVSGGGTPPFRAFVQTFGPSTTSTGLEVRRELDLAFNSSTSLSFQLRYPENSQFVVVVSDASGFASGGTSVASTVQKSDDASCFDPNTVISPPWTYAMTPTSQLVQCQATRLWWTDGKPQGTPSFYGIIPGGESFQIPQGAITTIDAEGTGFSWTPNLRTGTAVILVAGDDAGVGTGGSTLFTVGQSTDNDDSCLSGTSPSSTPGSPAGGTYPTATSGAGTGGSNSTVGSGSSGSSGSSGGSGGGGSSPNIGAIVGGVVGGIAALLALGLILLFCLRRKRFHKQQKERPVDLLQGDSQDGHPDNDGPLPQYYRPEPFLVPDPTAASTADGTEAGGAARAESRASTTNDMISGTGGPSSSTGTRKTAVPPPLRAVNIIQHDDAGAATPAVEETPETIELPPAYNKLRA